LHENRQEIWYLLGSLGMFSITILQKAVTEFCKLFIRHCNNEFSTSAVQLILKQAYVDPACGSAHRETVFALYPRCP